MKLELVSRTIQVEFYKNTSRSDWSSLGPETAVLLKGSKL